VPAFSKNVLDSSEFFLIQSASQKLLLTTKESILSSSIFSGPPCIAFPRFHAKY